MSAKEDNFHLEEVNHQELLQILLSYFGHTEESKPKGYKYKKIGTDFFLDVQLDKTGKIEKISLSQKFPREELSKIEDKIKDTLINNQNPGIGQVAGFSSERVEGYFRYKDLFQIIPVPQNAPKPKVLVADHPFLLQFSYTSCPDINIDNIRRSHKSNVYIRLLNLFSNLPIHLGSRYSRSSWTIDANDPNDWTSKWRQELYIYKGFSGKIDEYDPIDDFPQIKRVPYQEYYSALPAMTSEPLKFPNNLEKSFDLALNLNERDWKRFFMACSWYQAKAILQESSSSAYIALVSAIECLTDEAKRCPDCGQTMTEGIEKCKRCGQLKYKVTKKFKEFLKKHTPFLKEQFPKEEKLLYEVRSKLSHGLDLLMQDLEPWNFMMSVKTKEELSLQETLIFITRIAIYNWLQSRVETGNAEKITKVIAKRSKLQIKRINI